MKGSIQKKGKTYYAVFPLNGKRKWIRGGDTKKDAQRVLTEKLSEINQGTYREVIKAKFRDFSEKWIKDYAEVKVKPSTLAGYKNIIAKLLNPAFGDFNLIDITTGLLQSHTAERLKTVSAKSPNNLQVK